jgi:hypothetical protein
MTICARACLGAKHLSQISADLGYVLVIGGTIAAVAPFDIVFNAATSGSAILRVVLFCGLVVCGQTVGLRIGLRVRPRVWRTSLEWGLGFAIIVGVLVAATDFVFRHALPPSYVSFIHQPLEGRLIYFCLRAFNENVLYRLFLFSVLAFILSQVWRRPDDQPQPAAVALAMVLAQIINIGVNLGAVSTPESIEAVVYDGVRYIIPGVCWAWLYWKRDFAAAEIASTSCHFFLQPALSRLI